jgi:NAD(P)-dependent dehydrogenase (short-subunit alcohol dehydrogenase family)
MPSVLLTGANRGLGLGLARVYLEGGWDVIAVVRRSSPELEALGAEAPESKSLANGRLDIRQLDLCSDEQLAALASSLAGSLTDGALDVLINNAGRMARPKHQGLGSFDRALWHALFDINLFTPMRLAELFVQALGRAECGRIVTLSSDLGSMELNSHGGLYAYRASKAAVNAMTKSLAIDLAGRGIIAVAVSPGWVRTDMGGHGAELEVETSVRGIKKVIDGLSAEDSGKFISWDGHELPW